MNINIQREIDYEAKCYEGVTMKLRNLTSSQYKKIITYHPSEKDDTGVETKPAQVEYNMDLMFGYMVFDIENLTLTDESKTVLEIKTGKDIINNPGINDLYLELMPVLMKMEARIDSKN